MVVGVLALGVVTATDGTHFFTIFVVATGNGTTILRSGDTLSQQRSETL